MPGFHSWSRKSSTRHPTLTFETTKQLLTFACQKGNSPSPKQFPFIPSLANGDVGQPRPVTIKRFSPFEASWTASDRVKSPYGPSPWCPQSFRHNGGLSCKRSWIKTQTTQAMPCGLAPLSGVCLYPHPVGGSRQRRMKLLRLKLKGLLARPF